MVQLTGWPTVTNDSGTKRDGTVFNRTLTDAIRASIEASLFGATADTPATIIAEVVAARDGEASLLAKLQSMEAEFATHNIDTDGVAGENLALGDACYISSGLGGKTAGRWYKTDADNSYSSSEADFVGFAKAAITAAATGSIRLIGRVTGLSGLTAGTRYYVSATAGALTAAPPNMVRFVGVADSTTTLLVGSPQPQVSTGARWLSMNQTSVGNVGAGEDDLMSYALEAGKLAVDGQSVSVIAWGTVTNANEAKVIKLYFGATSVTMFTGTVATAGDWTVAALITRRGATTQYLIACGSGNGGTIGMLSDNAAPGETLANAITIKLTGQATTTDAIVQQGMLVR